MEPRLKSSQKWVHFPKDVDLVIRQALREQFPEKEANGEFIVEGWIYPEEIVLRAGYLGKGMISQFNFESSIDFDANKMNAINTIQILMEASASFMASHFENEDMEMPRDWQDFEFDGDKVYLRHTRTNSKLEAEADKLLGEERDKAIVHKDEELEIDELIDQMGLKEDKKPTTH